METAGQSPVAARQSTRRCVTWMTWLSVTELTWDAGPGLQLPRDHWQAWPLLLQPHALLESAIGAGSVPDAQERWSLLHNMSELMRARPASSPV